MRRIAGVALLGALLVACGSETSGPSTAEYEAAREQKLQSEDGPGRGKKKSAATVADATETGGGGLIVDYVYDATGKRDPFRSFVLEEAARKNKGERGPLEQFELGQLALHAVVWGTDNPRALIMDPQGRGYIVKEGTPIGKSAGQITRINNDVVIVREVYEDTLGGRTEKDIEMRIRQSQGG